MHRILLAALLAVALVACSGGTKTETEGAAAQPAADPQPAAAQPAADPVHKAAKEEFAYVCKDSPDQTFKRPGKCDDGTMRVADVPDGVEVEYFCPMCAGQEGSEPARCTECGMFLSARIKGSADKATDKAADHEHDHSHDDHEH